MDGFGKFCVKLKCHGNSGVPRYLDFMDEKNNNQIWM